MIKLTSIIENPISGEWGCEDPDKIGLPILRTTNFTNEGNINYNNIITRIVKKNNIKEKFLQFGDILLEKSGGSEQQPVGRVVFFENENNKYLCNNFITILRLKNSDTYVNKFVFYSLFYNYIVGGTKKFQNKTTGLHNLQVKSFINTFQIKSYSIDKQQIIVKILDTINNLIKQNNDQLDKLNLLVKSRFVEMFGIYPANQRGWEKCTIRDIVTDVRYGSSRPAVNGGKYPYLRMNNITYGGELDLSDIKRIDIPDNELEKCTVKRGDILFNRTNSKELVGKTCVYNRDEMMILAGFVIRVRVTDRILPEFLSAFLNSDFSKKMLLAMSKTAIGQANINAQELQNIGLYLPPIELQERFVRFKEQVDKSKFAVKQSLEKLEILKKSLMQEYFG